MAVGKDSFEIGKGEGNRQALSITIFSNLQFSWVFLSAHDPVSLLFYDFSGPTVICFFLKSSFYHFSSEYNISNQNQQFWPENKDPFGEEISP
jgi:hypothetical protein